MVFSFENEKGERPVDHAEGVYIIKAKPCISSIPKELYLIKPQGKYTLTRDDIRRTSAARIYSPCGLMIYQACGLDKQRNLFW